MVCWYMYIYKYECECIAGGNLEKLWGGGGEVCVLFGYRFIIYIWMYIKMYIYGCCGSTHTGDGSCYEADEDRW